ncbi:DM13 domain-containing protein [uncultured Arcticibacterium sp.]|uniref:DM13 domain-containing protein n=1 Tax=uncultured Arcticibacterium sp. TaxID=2173042 RepID=UPI0030F9E2A8
MSKKILLPIALFSILFTACSKTDVNPPEIISDEEIAMNNGDIEILYNGDFMDAAHPTSGLVQVYEENGVKKLRFTNFKTDSGPDLRVYLAENDGAANFIEVSKKVENGTLEYTLPAEVDLSKQNHVLIWCKLFKVNFGTAVLAMPQ